MNLRGVDYTDGVLYVGWHQHLIHNISKFRGQFETNCTFRANSKGSVKSMAINGNQ